MLSGVLRLIANRLLLSSPWKIQSSKSPTALSRATEMNIALLYIKSTAS
jgi:hypothetical protein